MIRNANVYDIPKINQLGKLINEEFESLFKMNDILNEDVSLVYVYENNADIIAFMHATILYETVDIINLIVHPKHRKKQIGSLMLDYLFSEISKDVKIITLEVAVDNKAAIALYKKFGFEVIHRRKRYYKDKDAYLMGRKL